MDMVLIGFFAAPSKYYQSIGGSVDFPVHSRFADMKVRTPFLSLFQLPFDARVGNAEAVPLGVAL